MKKPLHAEFIKRLLKVNDESRSAHEHERSTIELVGWLQGVEDATDRKFNGDHYYIEKFDSGEMKERPMCCGIFLDWEHKNASNG